MSSQTGGKHDNVIYYTAGQITKNSYIYKNIIYILFFDGDVCVKKEYSQREFAHIFLLWWGPFWWSIAMAGKHMRGSWQVCSSDRQVSAFSPKLQTLYCLLKSHTEIWTRLFTHIFSVYGWLLGLTYIWVFFPIICWSYLWTEISVTLFIGNKLYHVLFFSFLRNHFMDVILRPHWLY